MIRLNQRLLARLGLFVLPAALLFGVVALPGCNKDKEGGTPAAAGGSVGVVDYDRVFSDYGWKAKIQKDMEATRQNYKIAFDSFTQELNNAVKDKRQQIATAAKLSIKQAEDLANVKDVAELDKFNLSQTQKNEFLGAVQNANAYAQRADQVAGQMLRQREQQLGQAYLDALKAPVRKVAESSNVSVVIPSGSVSYFAAGVDLSNKVVDDLRATNPAINIPDAQKLDLPKVKLDQPPTTAPSTTQPSK